MVDDERLIELVRENPVLYDLSHPDYIRTKLKDEIWDKIGAELGSNGKTVKEQWRKLRERHREALRRQKIKKSGAKAEIQRPWMYQQHMDFLLPYMKNRSTSTNVEQESSVEINTPDDGETVTEGYTQDKPEIDNSNESERSHSADSDTPTVKRIKQSDQTAIRRFIQTAEMRCKNRDELRQAALQRDPSNSLQTDALYQFFLSMYYTTKGLPGKYQRRIRNKIYEAVSQAEEEIEFEKSRNTPLCPSFSERPVNSSSSFAGQIPNNIVTLAFAQAGEENACGPSTTNSFSPPYSEGTASSSLSSDTLQPIQPQPSTAWSVTLDQEAQQTFLTSSQ